MSNLYVRAIFRAILMKHVSLFISKDRDDHLNEFLSSLGDPSSPVIEDFDFTSGKYQIIFLFFSTVPYDIVGFFRIIYSALAWFNSRF